MASRPKAADIVAECLDKLNDKRRATREEGLEGLIGAFEGFVPVDELDHMFSTVMDRCCDSLLKGDDWEAMLAYRAIGLFALTVASAGAERCKEILEMVIPIAEETIQASFDEDTLIAAIDCLAAVTFACARHPEDTERPIEAMLGVIINPGLAPNLFAGFNGRTNPRVLSAAVSAWALLLTTLGDVTNSSASKQIMMSLNDLAKLLESVDSSVRMAVSEALAACFELDLTQHASPEDMEALEVQLSDLFQQIVALLNHHGEFPCRRSLESSLNGRGGMLWKSAWTRTRFQIKFLKRSLGKGFTKHLRKNPFFRDYQFSALQRKKSKLGKKIREKRWSKDMRRDRAIRSEDKNLLP